MVATIEFDNLIASRDATGHSQSSHHSFGARVNQTYPLEGGYERTETLGQLDLDLGVDPERGSLLGLSLDRFDHLRMGMTQDHCTPRTAEVGQGSSITRRERSALS
jgi:hypothetical protein